MLRFPVGLTSLKAVLTMPESVKVYQQQMQPQPCATIDAYTAPNNTYPQMEEVRVDMAGMKVECRPVELLTSVGSCVAICMYDSLHKCGGLAHIMLPHSPLGLQEPLPSKFADTAVAALASGIRGVMGMDVRLSAKIAGGANMFANTSATSLDIGSKNVKAVKDTLNAHKIKLVAEDVGGTHGRRITFSVASSITVVRLHNGEIRRI